MLASPFSTPILCRSLENMRRGYLKILSVLEANNVARFDASCSVSHWVSQGFSQPLRAHNISRNG